MLTLARRLLNPIFPAFCLHCEDATEGSTLCKSCAELLTPLTEQGRCWRCFQERPCKRCKRSPFARSAAVFPHYGPISSVITSLPHSPHLAKGCAGYIAYQLQALKFPTPHLLIPPPSRKLSHLTHILAKLLGIPCIRALAPTGSHVRLRRAKALRGKTILLVTDLLDERWEEWGITLQAAEPRRLYGMGLCLDEANMLTNNY